MILIIGAGITGLTCAAALKGEILVVESQEAVGGYCRTTKRNGFVWDRAGHFFHFNNSKVRTFFYSKIPESSFVKVNKKTSIFLNDIGYIDFPFQKNIHQLPKQEYIECLTDLYNAEKAQKVSTTFKDFVYATTGKKIADLFLVPYNQKLYACDLDELDRDAMGRFFPKTTFEDILLNAINPDNTSYNGEFSYPKDGAEVFVNVMKDMAECNAEIRLNTTVKSINLTEKSAILSDGSVVHYDVLINTSPLDLFCKLVGVEQDNKTLTANKVAVFNLGFDKAPLTDMHWIYYPGNEIFYRVGFYNNILSTEKASLYVEIGLERDQDFDEKVALKNVLSDLKKSKIIDDSMQLVDYEFILMNPAYVHINQESEALKTKLKQDFSINSVYTAGRYGNWTYCSIEDNILEAYDLAKKVCADLDTSDCNIQFSDFLNEGK